MMRTEDRTDPPARPARARGADEEDGRPPVDAPSDSSDQLDGRGETLGPAQLREACTRIKDDLLDSLDLDRARDRLMSSLFGRDKGGVRIGPYVLERRLGAGAMGEVYAARDERLDRKVAIKVVRGLARGHRDELHHRLRREAQALARLSHPHVLDVYDFGEHAGRLFIAMELVDGVDLGRWLKLRRRRLDEILDVYHQAGLGLAAAHALGLVHRDFKPGNVLVGRDRRVRVADFGLAIATTQSGESTNESGAGLGSQPSVGVESTSIVGTPAYMAPEQAQGGIVDARSDQFSFCVSVFRALHGDLPLVDSREAGSGPGASSRAPRALPSSKGRRAEYRATLRRLYGVLSRGLAADPADRFDSMEELLEAVAKARRARPWSKRRTLPLTAVAVGLAAVALVTAPASNDRCRVDPQRVRGWTPDRREAVMARFEDSTLAFAGSSGTRVQQRLDAEATAWSGEYAALCEARRRPDADEHARALDRRMSCLSQRAIELDALTEVLAQADDEVLTRAVQMVEGLRPAGTCRNPQPREALDASAQSQTAAELRPLLAGAHALLSAGQFDQAQRRAEYAMSMAQAAGLDAPRAEARLILGVLARYQGDGLRAAQHLEAAFWRAQDRGLDEIAVEAAVELVLVQGRLLAQPQQAEEWTEHARALTQRLGSGPQWAPRLCMAQAMVLRADGRFEQARQMARCALDGFASPQVADRSRHADATVLLAIVLDQAGQHERARGYFEQALSLYRQFHGPEHPRVAELYLNMGASSFQSREYEQALERTRRGQQILARSFQTHASLVTAGITIGGALLQLGRAEDGRAALDEALAMARTLWPDGHLQIAELLSNRGAASILLGRYDEAARDLSASITMIERLARPDHPAIADAVDNLGLLQLEHTGQPALALVNFERARTLREQQHGPDHLLVARALVLEARCLIALGQSPAALERLSRARSIREATPPGGLPTLDRIAELEVTAAPTPAAP